MSLRQAEGYKSARRIASPAAVWYITDSRRIFIPISLTMLHKMYLVSSELFQKYSLAVTNKSSSKIEGRRKLPPLQSDNDKWITMSERLREEDVTSKAQLKDIANFMKQFLPEPTVQRFERAIE